MDNLITVKNLKIILPIAGVGHLIVLHLDKVTIISDSVFWILFIIPTFLCTIYLIKNLELIKSETYQIIKGIKLQLLKVLMCIVVFIFSTLISGWVLSLFILGINYLTKSSSPEEFEFEVIETYETRPDSNRFNKRTATGITFTDGNIIDHLILNEDYEYYAPEDGTIIINCNKGFFGYYVIQEVIY